MIKSLGNIKEKQAAKQTIPMCVESDFFKFGTDVCVKVASNDRSVKSQGVYSKNCTIELTSIHNLISWNGLNYVSVPGNYAVPLLFNVINCFLHH